MTNVLLVVSAADHWTLNDGTVHPSGFWGEELAMPHKIFTEAGWQITIATVAVKSSETIVWLWGLACGCLAFCRVV